MGYVATNQEYLNAYNDYLSENSITQAMTTGYVQLGDKVMPVNYDMFYEFLVNKIVLSTITNHEFADKLDFLYTSGLYAGSVIEDRRTVLVGKEGSYNVEDFETSVSNPFIKKKTGISVVYHKVDKHKKIKITYSEKQIKEACLTEGGINSLVNSIINDVSVQYSAWAYADKRSALTDIDYATRVPFTSYADFCAKVKDIVIDFKYFDNSYKYNSSCLYSPMNEKDILIIMSEKFKNKVDINYFTGLFNVSYAELKDNIHYIDEFDDETIKCLIVDRRGLYFKKTLDTARELPNPDDLTYNHTAHFWRMHSVSPHYNAVALIEVEEDSGIVEGENVIVSEDSYTITHTTPIKYTTDGSTPTSTNGTILTANSNLTISANTVLKFVTLEVVEGGEGEEDTYNIVDNSLRVSHYRFV